MTYILVNDALTALDGLNAIDFGPKLSDVWADIVEGFDPGTTVHTIENPSAVDGLTISHLRPTDIESESTPLTDIERAWGSWDNPTTVDTDLIV